MKELMVLLMCAMLPVVLFVSSCESSSDSDAARPVLMPLAVGNYWVYDSPVLDSFAVVDSREIDGGEWFTVSSSLPVLGTLGDGEELWANRQDGLWIRQGLIEGHELRYPARVGDSSRGTDGRYTHVIATDSAITAYGQTYRCYIYRTKAVEEPLFESGVDCAVAPGIGLVRVQGWCLDRRSGKIDRTSSVTLRATNVR